MDNTAEAIKDLAKLNSKLYSDLTRAQDGVVEQRRWRIAAEVEAKEKHELFIFQKREINNLKSEITKLKNLANA